MQTKRGLAMALLLAAWAWSGAAHAQTTLRIGLAEDPDILDPTLARTYVGRIVFASLCDKLFDITPDLKIVPQLATEWHWENDNKALVMKLRQGVKFQDGEPMDAAAVKFSLERHLTLPGSNRKAEISAVKSVEIVDDHTVKLVLDKPFAPLRAQLSDRAGMILSPKSARAEVMRPGPERRGWCHRGRRQGWRAGAAEARRSRRNRRHYSAGGI